MEDQQPDHSKSFLSMDKKAAEYRGKYLQAISFIEGTIDDTIADYFCPKNSVKKDEIMYGILSSDKMTLSNKYYIFSFLAEKHCKDLYDQVNPPKAQLKIIRKTNPDFQSLDSRADEMIRRRNQFAHRKFNYDVVEIFYGNQSTNISLDTKVAKEGKIMDAPLQLNDEIINQLLNEISQVHGTILTLSMAIKAKGLEQL